MFNNGTEKCSCPDTSCRRNGKCAECLAYHKEKGNLSKCQKEAKMKEENRK